MRLSAAQTAWNFSPIEFAGYLPSGRTRGGKLAVSALMWISLQTSRFQRRTRKDKLAVTNPFQPHESKHLGNKR